LADEQQSSLWCIVSREFLFELAGYACYAECVQCVKRNCFPDVCMPTPPPCVSVAVIQVNLGLPAVILGLFSSRLEESLCDVEYYFIDRMIFPIGQLSVLEH